jgi:mono/diheme cytochrome c family protein
MSRFCPLRAVRRLLFLALALAVAPAARAQQAKPEELAAQAKAILTKHCFQCHGKDPSQIKKKVKILDYAVLVGDQRKLVVPKSPDASLIVKRIEDPDNPMPPDDHPPVPDGERKVLRAWIAAGAPDFTKRVEAPRPAATETAAKPEVLAAQAKTILTKYCFECHGKDANKPKKKLKILDHAALLSDKRKLLVPGSPDTSLIIKRIENKANPMPPEDSPQVSDAERKVLRAWIAAGAPDFTKTAAVPAPTPSTTPTPPPATTPTPGSNIAENAPVNLDRELLNQAVTTLDLLRERGYKNAGVLKFRAKKYGEDEASDNVGPFNQALATRMELALVLANNDKNPVGILRDASLAAALTPKANHLLDEGRQVLFGPKYPLAWGDDTPVKADAFLTGGVVFSPTLRTMTVRLFVFAKDGNIYKADPFYAACDPELLIEAGESFLVRGGLKGDEPLDPVKAIEAAVALRKQQVLSPLLDKQNAPVSLEVRYDDKPVLVQFRDGKFQVPEPKEGQKVSFVVRRQAAADQRLGIVLKVNGQNTILRERLPEAQCRKWVLEPSVSSLTVDRIRTDDKDDPGELQAPAVPRTPSGEIRYSPDVGTISLVVFREARGKAAPSAGSDDLAVLARGAYPKDKAKDLTALKEQLHKDATPEAAAQGLAGAAKAGDEPRAAEFKADPTPVMALIITCSKP